MTNADNAEAHMLSPSPKPATEPPVEVHELPAEAHGRPCSDCPITTGQSVDTTAGHPTTQELQQHVVTDDPARYSTAMIQPAGPKTTQASGNPVGRQLYNQDQRDLIVEWIVSGLNNPAIFDRMRRREWALCNPRCLDGYRQRYGVNLNEIRKQRVNAALSRGFALRMERVEALQRMGERLEDVIETHLVRIRSRWVGPKEGGALHNEEFVDTDLTREFRQTLKDIGQEVGQLTPDFLVGAVLNLLPEHVRREVIALVPRDDDSGATADSGEEGKGK